MGWGLYLLAASPDLWAKLRRGGAGGGGEGEGRGRRLREDIGPGIRAESSGRLGARRDHPKDEEEKGDAHPA